MHSPNAIPHVNVTVEESDSSMESEVGRETILAISDHFRPGHRARALVSKATDETKSNSSSSPHALVEQP